MTTSGRQRVNMFYAPSLIDRVKRYLESLLVLTRAKLSQASCGFAMTKFEPGNPRQTLKYWRGVKIVRC